MPSINDLTIVTPPALETSAVEIDIDAIKKRWAELMGDTSTPHRNEVSELLSRHYADKSTVDEWTSWWHDSSILYRGSIYTSVVSTAAFTGMLVGLILPFIALATGIYYLANKIAMEHETHRRERGVRFTAETTELTKKLDELLIDFKTIGAEMTTALEEVRTKAAVIAKHNTEMGKHINSLTQEQETLQATIASVSAQAATMQNAQHGVTQAIDSVIIQLKSIDGSIEHATASVQGLDFFIAHFAETATQMRQTELNLEQISGGLSTFMQQATSLQPQPEIRQDAEFDDAVALSQRVISLARARRAQRALNLEIAPVSISPR